MRVQVLAFHTGVLKARCIGDWGVGSAGNPSGKLLTETLQNWIDDHPEESVSELEIDYRDVEYTWGDGPVSSVVPFFRGSVKKCRLIANRLNRDALMNLIQTCNLPWFEVVEVADA